MLTKQKNVTADGTSW